VFSSFLKRLLIGTPATRREPAPADAVGFGDGCELRFADVRVKFCKRRSTNSSRFSVSSLMLASISSNESQHAISIVLDDPTLKVDLLVEQVL
jgi:hypothetical protein